MYILTGADHYLKYFFFIFFARSAMDTDSSYFSCILINHNDDSFCLHHGSVCCSGHWGQQWHFPCCDPPHRNICNLHAFYRDTVWTSCRMTWNNTQWISFNDISFRAIVFKINSIPWTFQCNPGRVRGRGGAAGGCPLYFVERHKLPKFFINGPCYISLAPLGQVTPDRGQLTVELY